MRMKTLEEAKRREAEYQARGHGRRGDPFTKKRL